MRIHNPVTSNNTLDLPSIWLLRSEQEYSFFDVCCTDFYLRRCLCPRRSTPACWRVSWWCWPAAPATGGASSPPTPSSRQVDLRLRDATASQRWMLIRIQAFWYRKSGPDLDPRFKSAGKTRIILYKPFPFYSNSVGIHIRINPHWLGSLDPAPHVGGEKITHKNWKSEEISCFEVPVLDVLFWGLKASSVPSLDVLHRGLGLNKLHFFILKIAFFSSLKFYIYWSSKPWIWIRN